MIRNIEATLKECRARAEKFAEQFRPLLQDSKTLTPATVLQALKELEIIYEALGRVGSYAGLVYAADTRNLNIKTWSSGWSSARRRSATCCSFLSSNGSSWTTKLLAESWLTPCSRLTTIISRAYAATGRTLSQSRRRKSSMNETTPAATPSAGFFQKSLLRCRLPWKETARKKNSISARFFHCSTIRTGHCAGVPWKPSIKNFLSMARC